MFTSSSKVVSRFLPNDVIKMSCCCLSRSWREYSSAEMNAAVICSAVGHPAAGQSTETKADSSRNTAAMAALASARLFCRHFCNRQPGSRHPTARHAGSRDGIRCHFGATFEAWAECTVNAPIKDTFPRAVPARCLLVECLPAQCLPVPVVD